MFIYGPGRGKLKSFVAACQNFRFMFYLFLLQIDRAQRKAITDYSKDWTR